MICIRIWYTVAWYDFDMTSHSSQISAAVMGIEFSYAAETAFVSPTLLEIGVGIIIIFVNINMVMRVSSPT